MFTEGTGIVRPEGNRDLKNKVPIQSALRPAKKVLSQHSSWRAST